MKLSKHIIIKQGHLAKVWATAYRLGYNAGVIAGYDAGVRATLSKERG